MELYFGQQQNGKILLGHEEANHLVRVRRTAGNSIVHATDGNGNLFETILESSDKQSATLHITNTRHSERRKAQLHIAVAPTKNSDRIEWFLEKAIETGIDEISFLRCAHSERKNINHDRLNRVAIAAMKQSLKYFLPKINSVIEFSSFVENNLPGKKLTCSMSAGENSSFANLYSKGESLVVMIGPEGDFTGDELTLAGEKGYQPLSLGQSRLRTETAALNVCSIFNFLNL